MRKAQNLRYNAGTSQGDTAGWRDQAATGMFKKLFGQGGGHGGGGGGGGGGGSHQPRQMTANSTQKTVDAIQKLGEVCI